VKSYYAGASIHIVKNPSDETMSPWYKVTDALKIVTRYGSFIGINLRGGDLLLFLTI
jgi:hypothetical protein